jgi:hypothetical protein
VGILLIICVIAIPYRLAFADEGKDSYSFVWDVIYYCMDICFLLDIIMAFFTAIPQPD